MLDNPGSGTWSELAAAHRNLTPGPSSPSGLHDMFGSVPYAFPAATQITGLGAVSDALVGRVRWDNPAVVAEQTLLFDPATRDAYVREWIDKAKKAFERHWDVMRGAELAAFGDAKSFFTNYRMHGKNVWEHVPPPDEEEPHDEDEDEEEEGEEAPLDLDRSIEELESDQQEADKSGESFLMEGGAVVAGRHRTAGSGALELSGARITRAMAARGRTGP